MSDIMPKLWALGIAFNCASRYSTAFDCQHFETSMPKVAFYKDNEDSRIQCYAQHSAHNSIVRPTLRTCGDSTAFLS